MVRIFCVGLLFFAWLGLTHLQAADAPYATIIFVKGDMKLESSDNKIVAAKSKDQIKSGTTIHTGPDTVAVIRMMDGSSLKIEENTTIKIEELIASKNNEATGASRLLIRAGGIMVNVVKKYVDRPSLEVTSEKGISFGVRGTTFMVFHDEEEENFWAVVKEGSVWAINNKDDDVEVINKGAAMVAYKGKDLTAPMVYKWSKKIDWDSMSANTVKQQDIAKMRQEELKSSLVKVIKRRRKTKQEQKYLPAPGAGEHGGAIVSSSVSSSSDSWDRVDIVYEEGETGATSSETTSGVTSPPTRDAVGLTAMPTQGGVVTSGPVDTFAPAAEKVESVSIVAPAAETVESVSIEPAADKGAAAAPPPANGEEQNDVATILSSKVDGIVDAEGHGGVTTPPVTSSSSSSTSSETISPGTITFDGNIMGGDKDEAKAKKDAATTSINQCAITSGCTVHEQRCTDQTPPMLTECEAPAEHPFLFCCFPL